MKIYGWHGRGRGRCLFATLKFQSRSGRGANWNVNGKKNNGNKKSDNLIDGGFETTT
jgi:hypothetical protein